MLMRSVTSRRTQVSDCDSPLGSTACRRSCTRRSRLVYVPSCSAKATRGSTMSACSARSLRKRSWTTRSSDCDRAWRAASSRAGLSPTTWTAFTRPSRTAWKRSLTPTPGVCGRSLVHALSNMPRPSASSTATWPGRKPGTQPTSHAPCSLVPGEEGEEAGAGHAEVAGGQREVDQALQQARRLVGGNVVEGVHDAAGPVGGEEAGGLLHLAGGDARGLFDRRQREGLQRPDEVVPAFGLRGDEVAVLQALVGDDPEHAGDQRGLRAGVGAEPDLGVAGQLHLASVDDDELERARLGRLLQRHRGDVVVLGRVAVDDEDGAAPAPGPGPCRSRPSSRGCRAGRGASRAGRWRPRRRCWCP